jgi:hypothetical protein
MYWLLTLLRGTLRLDRVDADLEPIGPAPRVEHLVASIIGYRLFWTTLVVIEAIAFVVLVLVR